MPSKIIIKNSVAPQGAEQMVIMRDASGGKLRLFPGSNQVVLTSIRPSGGEYNTYKSFDSGDTFEQQPTSFPVPISGFTSNIAVSFNNRYYFIGDPSTIDSSSYIAVSNNGSNSWDYKAPSASNVRRYHSVNSSRDGRYVLATNGAYNDNGDVALSQDFGENWTFPLTANRFTKTFVSPTGENMFAGNFTNGQTKYSDDSGDNWSTFPETLSSFGGGMISGDGNYKVVHEQYQSSGGAKLYISTDWINWSLHSLTVRLVGGSISNDGKYMLVAASDGFNSPEDILNLSNDYGQTWTEVTPFSTSYWAGTAMSSDGKYMIAIPGFATAGYTYKSVDYGQTWELVSDIPQGKYNTVQMSKSGRYIYITGTDEGIFVSKNYMATWNQQYDASTGGGVFINF